VAGSRPCAARVVGNLCGRPLGSRGPDAVFWLDHISAAPVGRDDHRPPGPEVTVHDLPAINATLNATSGVLLLTGYGLIRARRIDQHRLCMIAAFTTSSLFLVSYLIYHAQVGSVPFPRYGLVRPLYYTI